MLRNLLNRTRTNEQNTTAQTDAILARWEIVVGLDSMIIRPVGPVLTQQDLGELAARLESTQAAAADTPIEFDFSGVEKIGPQWTIVLATLVHLSRKLSANCSITGLHGQPAAAVNLYRRSASLMNLVTPARAAA